VELYFFLSILLPALYPVMRDSVNAKLEEGWEISKNTKRQLVMPLGQVTTDSEIKEKRRLKSYMI